MERKAFAMNCGTGEYSYKENSQYQRSAANSANELIKEAIHNSLDITSIGSTTIRIADFGCSSGPNTFFAIQNILEAMETKCKVSELPDFHVFFNDQVSNDFNLLFTSLSPNRNYFAAGVPGSFHGRLFPKSSLHIAYSAHTLHWLSQAPQDLLNKSSPAWNNGRIHYTNASKEVKNVYADQFVKDIDTFLSCRAEEIISGGLMMLIVPGLPDDVHYSELQLGVVFKFLEQTLMDMVKVGSISEAEVDSFNLPMYIPNPKEMRELVERNASFSVERIEITNPLSMIVPFDVPTALMHFRAVSEDLLATHFGNMIVDQMFEHALAKSTVLSSAIASSNPRGIAQLFMVLKRK